MSIGDDVRRAVREAELGLDLIDIMWAVRRDIPGRMIDNNRVLVLFFNDWNRFKPRSESSLSEAAAPRAWERWKSAVRSRGLAKDRSSELLEELLDNELIDDEYGPMPLLIDTVAAEAWSKAAVERAKTLSSAARSAASEKSRRLRRTASAREVFAALDILYTSTRLATWLERGAPLTAVRRGRRMYYYASPDELEDWIKAAVVAGEINDPFRERIPIDEARPRILAAIEKSGLSKLEFAGRLGLNDGVLQSYVLLTTKVKKVPLDVIEKAEELGKKAPGSDRHSKYSRTGSPPLSAIKAALKASGGNLSEASRALTGLGFSGVSPENVRYVALKHDLSYVSRRIIAPTRAELVEILQKADYNTAHAARESGISWKSVSMLIDRYGLRETVEQRRHHPPTKDDILRAIDSAGHDAVKAGALVGVSESRFRLLLSEYGLSEHFAELAAAERDKTRLEERNSLSAEIEKSIQFDETRDDLARRLDMKRMSVEAAVRRLGLRDRYNELRYAVGGKARGSGRVIEEGASRIPFWLAALRELRSDLPDHGGGEMLADELGVAGSSVVSTWLAGKRVPRYEMIEKIMALADRATPDWRAVLESAMAESKSIREASVKIGIERNAFYGLLKGHVSPSEKMLEKILGDDFWVAAAAP